MRLLYKRIISVFLCLSVFSALWAGVNVNEVYGAEERKGAPPELRAKGAILVEFDTGRILYEKNAEEPMANASTTKIMTAILTLERCALSDVVTASANAARTPPVKMYLQTGEKQTVEDLLYALMLESANDAAVALAEHVGGSVEGFAELMNEKARELGAKDTEFVTPNGLDSGNHHTTPLDLSMIARYALANKDFQRIIQTKSVTTPVNGGDFKKHSFANKDRLLYEYDGAMGIKTGFTNKAGHCFVGAAKRNGMLIISVVLASGWGNPGRQQKWVDTKALLNYGFNNYKYVNIAKADTFVDEYDVSHSKGNTVALKLEKDVSLPIAKGEEYEVRYSLPDELDAPVNYGDVLGYAEVFVNGSFAADVPLIADRDVPRHDFNISIHKITDYLFDMDLRDLL